MSEIDLAAIQTRLAATTGDRWELDLGTEGEPAVKTHLQLRCRF